MKKTTRHGILDFNLSPALIRAHDLIEPGYKIDPKICALNKRKDKFDSFIEYYLVCSSVLCIVLSIVALILALLLPPGFIKSMWETYSGFLRILFTFFYILAVELVTICFVFGLFFVFWALGDFIYSKQERSFARKVLKWVRDSGSTYAINLCLEFRQRTEFLIDSSFYKDMKDEFTSILSFIFGTITQERVDAAVARVIEEAQKRRDIDALIRACYYARYSDFNRLLEKLSEMETKEKK